MAARRKSRAGRDAKGRFKRMRGKNAAAAAAGRKGHRKSCRKARSKRK